MGAGRPASAAGPGHAPTAPAVPPARGLPAPADAGSAGVPISPASVPRVPSDSLPVAVSTDRPMYVPGQPIPVRLRLRNAGPDTVTLEFATSQRFDLMARDSAGALRWRWSRGLAFLPVLGTEVLGPGDTLLYEATARDTLPPGRYRLVGVVLARGRALADTAAFRVRR